MESRHRPAVPLVFLLISLILVLVSCSNAQQNYNKGNYQSAIKQIDSMDNPDADDYLLKAKSYIALGEEEKAVEGLFLYLTLTNGNDQESRAYAVDKFLELNTYDRLTIMAILPDDGTQAQKELYKAYSRLGDTDKAMEMLNQLSRTLGFKDYVSLMIDEPADISYIVDILTAWYGSIAEADKQVYLDTLLRFSKEVAIPEIEAKRFLDMTNLLMNDSFYTEDDIRLSCLLKIKGNILEMLFDKVNARIYWTQAYRFNPNDQELKDKLQL